MFRDGQWVSYDNRRVMAARLAGVESVPVEVVEPGQMQAQGRTWEEAFQKRYADPRNVSAGGPVPNQGLPNLPEVARRKKGDLPR